MLLLLAGVAAEGIWQRTRMVATLQTSADQEAVPLVSLVLPQPGPKTRGLSLPGETAAWYQAPIFAQVVGYVQMWYKDYGAAVKQGDLLAEIATPDLDQQVQQARAELAVAKTKAALARVTAARWQKLAGTQAVSQETVDVNSADAQAAAASVQAAQANLSRLEAQEAFKRVVAPFDGVVTARSTDVGNFVNAAGAVAQQQGHVQALFSVADVHEIRVYVAVPQDYSSYIHSGMSASLTMPQFPHESFPAKVLTVAKAFDPNARTVVTELVLPNPEQKIWPGGYVEAHFKVPADPGILTVPEQSVLFRAQGLQVAVVGKDDRVHLQDITVGLNLGERVQITSGLSLDNRIIENPSEGLLEGQQVAVAQAPGQAAVSSREGSVTPGLSPS